MASATSRRLYQGQKPNPTLMIQNCDLPPPVNVFTGLSDTNKISSNSNSMMMMEIDKEKFSCEWDKEDLEEDKLHGKPCLGLSDDDNKLELLKALRLSQTRAREGEETRRELVKENKSLSNAIIHQSMELIAYRNLVKLLELQTCFFRSKLQNHQAGRLQSCANSCSYRVKSDVSERKTSSEEPESMSWVFALVIPIGIAGLGITLACRYIN